VGKKTTGLALTFAALAVAVSTAAPASAQAAPPPGGWIQTQNYQSNYLCQSAGLVGEFFGLWRQGQWKCVGTALFVLQGLTTPPAG
jgi:hypothetical protein